MADDPTRTNTEVPSETAGEEAPASSAVTAAGRFPGFKALVGIVAFPRTSFEIIRERQPWAAALALILAVLALTTLLTLRDLTTVPGDAEPAAVLYGPSAAITAAVLISLPIEALLLWRLSLAFGAKARFMAVLSLMVHVDVVVRLGGLVSYLLSKGRQALEPADLSSGWELDRFNPALHTTVGALLEGAARISVSIWALILLGLGIAAVARLPKRMGLGIAGFYAALMAALANGFERMVEVVMQSLR